MILWISSFFSDFIGNETFGSDLTVGFVGSFSIWLDTVWADSSCSTLIFWIIGEMVHIFLRPVLLKRSSAWFLWLAYTDIYRGIEGVWNEWNFALPIRKISKIINILVKSIKTKFFSTPCTILTNHYQASHHIWTWKWKNLLLGKFMIFMRILE